jgi:hypothetical protein
VKRRKGLLDEEKFLPPLPEQLPRGVSSLPGYGQTSPVAQGLLGFTGRNPTYSVMSPEAQQMSDAYRLGEQASVASQLYGSMLPFAAASTMASAQRAGSLLSPLTVFHGSPHKFSKFDASKIGTGEGAQAYGHGLYFAESPSVAGQYKASTSANMYDTSKGVIRSSDLVDELFKQSGNVPKNLESAYRAKANEVVRDLIMGKSSSDISQEIRTSKYGKTYSSLADALDNLSPKSATGSLYKVDLPDEQIAKMLDWDKPLSQQPESVRAAFYLDKFPNASIKDMTGREAYVRTGQMLGEPTSSSAKVAEHLRSKGIPGIRYLDEGSRGNYQAQTTYKGKPYGDVVSFATQKQLDDYVAEKTAEGFGVNRLPQSSNFVVFPGEESKLKMLEINGKPVVIDEEELLRGGLLGVAR